MNSNKERGPLILFAVCVMLSLAHQYTERIANIPIPLIDSYLDPLVFMPILLQTLVWERRLLRGDPAYTVPRHHVFGYFLLVSILCEAVLPLWNAQMIADGWDVLMYAFGSLVYALIANPSSRKSTGQASGD